MNERMLNSNYLRIKRFFALDHQARRKGWRLCCRQPMLTELPGTRKASLTGRRQGIVQRVPISDRATGCSGRRLNRGRAGVHRLVDSSKHAAVSRVVFQRVDATLTGRLADAGKGYAVAAEAILPGDRVPQQDRALIAVILKRRIERGYRKRARCSVAGRVGCRASHSRDAGREARPGGWIANHCDSGAVVRSHRIRVSNHRTGWTRADILIRNGSDVSRASDLRRLRVVHRDREAAARRVAR